MIGIGFAEIMRITPHGLTIRNVELLASERLAVG
jgi:hypothetical protein